MMKNRCNVSAIIQGGMGIGVSGYSLARAAAQSGALGVVSGTAIDTVFVRRVQLGDDEPGINAAAASFPFPRLASQVVAQYRGRGLGGHLRFKALSLLSQRMSFDRVLVMVLASYIEVWLARRGHDKPIGMNLLEKVQLPTLSTLFGGMLAGLDVVLMGAGVPAAIPETLRRLAALESATIKLHVDGQHGDVQHEHKFDPKQFLDECARREVALGGRLTEIDDLSRPLFFAIVSSEILAKRLAKVTDGQVDGFVLEHHSAGGHNAPPRSGTAVGFGPRDEPKLEVMRALGIPFWLAGGRANYQALDEALGVGAAGVQIGSAFAFCAESGMTTAIKQRVLRGLEHGTIHVETDFRASPTGYPFKIVVDSSLPNERSEQLSRPRVCDLGYLRQAYVDEKGNIGFRCPAEPPSQFVSKGGNIEDTEGKLCLCNQLLSTVGLAQRRDAYEELPLVTAASDLSDLRELVSRFGYGYRAEDVISLLLAPTDLIPITQAHHGMS